MGRALRVDVNGREAVMASPTITLPLYQSVWSHLAMCGAMAVASLHEIPVLARHNPDTWAPTIDVDLAELAVRLHADATAMAAAGSPWRLTTGRRSLLAANWGPMTPEQRRAALGLRTEVAATLPEHWQDLAAGLGIPAIDGLTTRPRDGANFFDMTPLNRGMEIVGSRLVPAAEHVAARPVTVIEEALRTGRGELAKDSLLAGWGPAGTADSVHALLAMWGLTWFRPALQMDWWTTTKPRPVIPFTPCAVRVSQERGWLMFPVSATWWTAAKWRRVLRAAAGWGPMLLEAEGSVNRVVRWPREAQAMAVWERVVTAVGPTIRRDARWAQMMPALR